MPTVLVVDDTKFSRGRVVAALKSLDVQLDEACDGAEALARCMAELPDVVVTDLLMPNMNGLAFITALRSQGIDVPVIVVSADIQESSRVACRAHGVQAFINKPFQPEALRAEVTTALQRLAVAPAR
jgi:CheY-like chemotaxis protein